MQERRQDFELLQRFTRHREQSAFADLVRRHLDLVFATALRKVEDAGAAQEVAQNVFTALARKAWRFAPDDSLPAWLHKAALLESKSWLRGELGRRRREEAAVAGRFDASFSSRRRINASRPGGRSGVYQLGATGGALRCWLMIATDRPTSSAVNVRPMTGDTPRRLKKPGVTSVARTRSASTISVSVRFVPSKASNDASDRARSRHASNVA